MDVASYIREYLFKQDFLDIPGLGTFFLTKEPFRIDEENLIIKPGAKTLIFRENAGISNDTFSYFLARRAGISVDEARQGVHSFIGPIRQLFLNRGTIEIQGLGIFSVPDGFHLEFNSFPCNFSPSSFGLGIVDLSPFKQNVVEEPENNLQAEYPLEAEEIYKAYGFERTEEPENEQSSQVPVRVEHDTAEHDTAEHDTAEHDTAEHDTAENERSDTRPAEVKAPETRDLVFNPLAFTSSGATPVIGTPIERNQNDPVPEHIAENFYAQSYPPEVRKENNAAYWIIGGILLLGLVAGIAYLERSPILKSLNDAGLLNSPGLNKSPVKQSPVKKDSSLVTRIPLSQRSDSLKRTGTDSIFSKPKDSLPVQKQTGISALADSGLVPVTRASKFMIIAGSVHLLQTARKWQKEILRKGVNAEIIEMPKGILMRYKLSLGNYPDKPSATDALTALQAKGEKRAQVFENKFNKN